MEPKTQVKHDAPVDVLGLVNTKAEQHVLAAMRNNSASAVDFAQTLSPDDFYDRRHRLIFEASSNLLYGIEPIDTPALVGECRRILEQQNERMVIDVELLESIAQLDSSRGNMYANTLRRLSWLRRAAEFAHWMIGELQVRPDPDGLFSGAQERWQMLRPATKDTRFVYGWDTVDGHTEVISERIRDYEKGLPEPFSWPWPSWNNWIRPLRAGFLGVIAAPDGMGKTTYLESIAEHWAKGGMHVVFVHLEDALDYKLDRRLARHARVDMNHLETGNLTAAERLALSDAGVRLASTANTLHYYAAAGESMTAIIRELESRVAEGVCQAVVFDYLDKVQPTRAQIKAYGENPYERQGNDVEQLKSFGERNHLPVLTATQGNKTMQGNGTKTRSAIQGSGQKSHKSQLVVILTRPLVGDKGLRTPNGEVVAHPGEYSPQVNVRIDKQNRGRTGSFDQFLLGKYFEIKDIVIS
jgi:replicative DNA helicase